MNNQKGFTLIEMLVVIAIVGLLSSVVVVGLGGAREKARDARRIADIRQIQNALEVEYLNATGYKGTLAELTANVQLTDSQGVDYPYATTDSGFGYELGACLENADNIEGTSATCTITCTAGTLFCVTPN